MNDSSIDCELCQAQIRLHIFVEHSCDQRRDLTKNERIVSFIFWLIIIIDIGAMIFFGT